MDVEDDRERLKDPGEPGARKRKAETDLDLPANKCPRKVEPINQLLEIPEDILYEVSIECDAPNASGRLMSL